MGQIPTENSPQKALWLQRIYTLAAFICLPQRFNTTEELPDKTVAASKRGP